MQTAGEVTYECRFTKAQHDGKRYWPARLLVLPSRVAERSLTLSASMATRARIVSGRSRILAYKSSVWRDDDVATRIPQPPIVHL